MSFFFLSTFPYAKFFCVLLYYNFFLLLFKVLCFDLSLVHCYRQSINKGEASSWLSEELITTRPSLLDWFIKSIICFYSFNFFFLSFFFFSYRSTVASERGWGRRVEGGVIDWKKERENESRGTLYVCAPFKPTRYIFIPNNLILILLS